MRGLIIMILALLWVVVQDRKGSRDKQYRNVNDDQNLFV